MTAELTLTTEDRHHQEPITVAKRGEATSPSHQWFVDGLIAEMERQGHTNLGEKLLGTKLILNVTDAENPHPFRRKAQTTYVVGLVEVFEEPEDFIKAMYPVLVRSLSNLVMCLVRHDNRTDAHFVTMEQGHYAVRQDPSRPDEEFFAACFERLEPLVTAKLVINNIFVPDLPEDLWDHPLTKQCTWAGEKLDELNLLPAPWPLEDLLDERDRRHVLLLYGIAGLSYGNLSTRHDDSRFWMSATGVNKAKLREVGRDILLVTDYVPEESAMVLSVPPHVKPRKVSVDAIEHYMIYQEHPDVGAIVHIHAWMDGVTSTHINYPCGTQELALSVSELVRRAPDPSRAVVGLKNHGLTITGHSLQEIFERIQGKVTNQVPMS